MKSNSILKSLSKFIIASFTVIIVVAFNTLVVRADNTTETEPNDTKSSAQTINANNETAAGAVNGTYTGQHIISGYTSLSDEDWFKVYLNAGQNYLSCNGNSFSYTVSDSNDNVIRTDTYIKLGYGVTAYELDITTSGYYYVCINGLSNSSTSYLFLIGSPTYEFANCNIPCVEGSISMISGGGEQTGHFDGTSLSIPSDAIAYSVIMNGVSSSAVSYIQLQNNSNMSSISLNAYSWDKSGIVSYNMPVSSMWTATFGYKTVKTFTPVLKVYYVYPVYEN